MCLRKKPRSDGARRIRIDLNCLLKFDRIAGSIDALGNRSTCLTFRLPVSLAQGVESARQHRDLAVLARERLA